MKRRAFVTAAAAASACALPAMRAFAQDDPAISSSTPALRVLLGRGTFQPIDAQTFLYEGRRYRGMARVNESGSVVTTVPVEEYLYSVVSREMPRSWPAEAIRAQAILARTYVLQRSNPNREYDLVPSEADQVYTGMDAEAPQTNAAVDATAGKVLRFGGGFAQIAYSSCCGGHTESSADAWGGKAIPYLSGVACTYCKDSSWYRWTQNIGADRFAAVLGGQAPAIGDVQNIALDSIDSSGRARFWIFTGTQGTARIRASDVRREVGSRVLPSLLVSKIDLPPGAQDAAVAGAGLGHGVGFCQWGARGLAQTGASGSDILAYYFPGTSLGTS